MSDTVCILKIQQYNTDANLNHKCTNVHIKHRIFIYSILKTILEKQESLRILSLVIFNVETIVHKIHLILILLHLNFFYYYFNNL